MYDVHFHDGDHLEKMISSEHILRMDEFFKIDHASPYEDGCMPSERYLAKYYKTGTMTPNELLECACTVCAQCDKKECGACSACKQTQLSGARSLSQCCYQKVRRFACCKTPN
jgi:hypothetical protein